MRFVNLTIHGKGEPYRNVADLEPGFYVNENSKSIAIIENAGRSVIVSMNGELTVNPLAISMRDFKRAEISEILYREIE